MLCVTRGRCEETRCGDKDELDSGGMSSPLISEVLSDLLEEMVFLLQGTGAEPLEQQLRMLRIESICDCGDENCASFATAAEVKVDEVVELNPSEGFLIIDLNQAQQICFIEVLGRPDVKYLIEEHYSGASH
jgi:hypothetical protein